MKLEILAPVGNMQMLLAAVRCGADAVYLGTKDLNARRGADNFDFKQLADAVSYCHNRNVKVYVTLNTLVSDDEMEKAYRTVRAATECFVDGFIVQDLGVAKMIREHFPQARLHASTQCSVNTPQGFRQLEKMGFCRAVIPREMSLNEIKQIRKSTDMELEMFVHGALCMCVSGQCYLSAMIGSRSGNRGLCAQPCRLSFSADNSGSCDLSLKDLSLIRNIKQIGGAGVISLKIEGRMKRPEYVAASVTACKKAIEGTYNHEDEKNLRAVFSRSGFTDGYFTGKMNNMFGTRSRKDVVAADSVLKKLAKLYSREVPRAGIDFELTLKKDMPAVLTASNGRKTVTQRGGTPEAAINAPLTEDMLKARFSKLGGTGYYLNSFKVDLDDGLAIHASLLNELRRNTVAELDKGERKKIECKPFTEITPQKRQKTPYLTARFLNASTIPQEHPFKRIFIPVWSDNNDFIRHNAGVEIPRGLFGMEKKLRARLRELRELGVKNALCGNLGAYRLAENMGFKAYGDFGLNVFNSETAGLFNSPILSFEMTLRQANAVNGRDVGIIAYGYLPLMLCRNCPIKNKIGCDKCKKHGMLTDRMGYKFKVKCSSYPCVEILNPLPLYLGDKLSDINTNFIHFYFTDETKEQVEEVLRLYDEGGQYRGEHTRGLYYRGVI